MDPRPILQLIEIKWHKLARGGRLARVRSRMARAVPLPVASIPDAAAGIPVHSLLYTDADEFAEPRLDQLEICSRNRNPAVKRRSFRVQVKPFGVLEFEPESDVCRVGCVVLEPSGEAVEVRYRWSYEDGGAPRRLMSDAFGNEIPRVKQAFCLSPGEWGRLEYNGRFAYEEGGWYYQHVIANVGLFTDLSAGVFTDSEPDHSWQELARLW